MKKYYGGYEITEAMGYIPMDYGKITTFLNLIDAPQVGVRKHGYLCYCLDEKQIKFLKESLEKIKIGLYEKKT